MSNVFSTALVNVTTFGNGKLDKNGNESILLRVVAGKMPNRAVISGTVAKREGFEVGKNYLVNVMETEADATYGRQFNFQNFGIVNGIKELLEARAMVGEATIVNVDSEVVAEIEVDPKPKTEKVK